MRYFSLLLFYTLINALFIPITSATWPNNLSPSRDNPPCSYHSKAAARANVKLLPDTFYYFEICYRMSHDSNDDVMQWIRRQTEDCGAVALLIGRTSRDNTEFHATRIAAAYAKRWEIVERKWKGSRATQTRVFYRGTYDPEKGTISRLMSKGRNYRVSLQGGYLAAMVVSVATSLKTDNRWLFYN
ncbi:hypothetical protein LZ32DRAFT_613500 [Colletotrichum eremochloae]|nr:hypothetical protein LZ32DRAFT_613500 [Colletotrichum eremochloae]